MVIHQQEGQSIFVLLSRRVKELLYYIARGKGVAVLLKKTAKEKL